MKTKRSVFGKSDNNKEDLFSILAHYMNDNVFVQDTDLRYQMILNPQLGWSEMDILGKTDHELTTKEGAEKLTEIKKRVLETGESLELDIPLTSNTGETEYFSGTYIPKSDSEGNITGLIGYFRNLTEQVRYEKELSLFFELVPDMIVVASQDGYFKKLNKVWEKVLGFTVDELKSRPFAEFIHPDDLQNTGKEITRQLNNESTLSFTNRYLCKDGSYKWLEWMALPSPDGINLYATARDITEKRAAEERLRTSEERFNQVARSADVWVWEVDADGKYTYCSDSEVTLLGYHPEEIVGKKYFYDFFAPEIREELKKGALEAFAKKEPFSNFENLNVHKDGHLILLSTTGIPLLDNDGHLLGYRGADRDITDYKQKEDAIRKQANLLDIAHDSIIVRDKESRVTFWNKGAEACYGWTQHEVLGQVTHAFLGTVFPVPLEEIERILLKEGFWEGELSHRRKDGVRIIVSSRWQKREIGDSWEVFEINNDISDKKNAEKTLQESEDRFRKAFYTNPDAITVTRVSDGRYISVNNGFKNLFGYEEEEIIGKTSYEIGIWEDPGDRDLFVRKLQSEGIVENFETRLRSKDGRKMDCLVSSTIIVLDGVNHLLSTTRDISEIKLAQYQLQESESRFRKIYEDGPYGMALVSRTLQFLLANATLCKMLDYTESQLKQLTIKDITYGEGPPGEREELQKLIRGEISMYRVEKQYVKKDGTVLWGKLTASAIYDENGKFLYNLGIIEDISQRRETEKALKEAYERLNLATDAAGIGIWDWDIENNVLSWDSKMYKLYGFQPDEKREVYETWLNGLHPDDRESQNAVTQKSINRNVPYDTEFRVVWPDGSIHWLKASGQVFRNSEGQPIRMVGVNYDISEKKKEEESTRRQNERMDAILRAIPDLIFVIDRDGKYHEVVASEPEKLLIPVDKIVGSNVREVFPPDLTAIFMSGINSALEQNEIQTIEYVISMPGSPSTHYEARIAPLDETKVMVLSRDISEEAKKEAEINKLSLAVDQSPVSVVITDLEGNIEYANHAFEGITGYTLAEVSGKNTRILQSGQTDKALYRNMWDTIQSGKVWNGELVNKKKNGELYWETLSISPIYDSLGFLSNYLAVKLDITERKQTEALLIQNEEKYRFMFINNPQPMWIYDLDTLRFLEVNDSAVQHYGYSREEFLDMDLMDLRPPEDLSGLTEDIRNTRITEGEWRHRKKNGDIITAEIYSHGIIFMNREARHVLVNDITKRKQAEQEIMELNAGLEERINLRTNELAEANQYLVKEVEERKKAEIEIMRARSEAEKANLAKSDFLSRMSHELRTPLNSILGFAQLLEMGTLNTGQKKGVSHILNSGKHLLDLINEILDISRIEAGRLALSIEPVQASGLILEVLDSIQLQASARNIQLSLVSSPGNQLFVRSDRQRLKQVLLNLVNNAVKYNREGGTISVETTVLPSAGSGPASLRISVSDSGPGIAAEDLPKLFTPFERIGAEKSVTEGTGLGLAVVSKLMEAMGGKNGVHSVPGEGSTFWIELPVADNQLSELIKSGMKTNLEVNLAHKKGTLLYVEDNESNIELVGQILTSETPGIVLEKVVTGGQALQKALECSPDLILLDLNLPDMHGSEVIRLLSAHEVTKSIPVVIISADAMPSQQKKLLQLGARKYLTKPLDVTEFLRIIDEFIHGPGV